MSDPADPKTARDVAPAPKLPEVDSPPADDVLDGVPSKEEVVEEQPSVDEILGRDR